MSHSHREYRQRCHQARKRPNSYKRCAFASSNATPSFVVDLLGRGESTANVFGIVGDEYFIRHFAANQAYGNCPADVGWFVVSNGCFCAWETPVTQPAQTLGPISLVYANLSTATLWTSISRGRADSLAVYVR